MSHLRATRRVLEVATETASNALIRITALDAVGRLSRAKLRDPAA